MEFRELSDEEWELIKNTARKLSIFGGEMSCGKGLNM